MTKEATLRKTDRCDRCGHQAIVMVLVPLSGEPFEPLTEDNAWPLAFCKHHFDKAEPGLPEDSVIYADDRETLV